MFNLSNPAAYVEPVSIPPVLPDFAFCHSAYGNLRQRKDATMAAGILPLGSNPIIASVTPTPGAGRAQSYTLPFYVSYSGVAISVEVSGPVVIEDIVLVPNSIRGMAAYLANTCVGNRGTGGFVTSTIQGLVDYVTDPVADLDLPTYPDSTAFITLTMSSMDHILVFPGDHDPIMAIFLQQAETNALRTVLPKKQAQIRDRVFRYAHQAKRMTRLGALAWWKDNLSSGRQTGASNQPTYSSLNNSTLANTVTSRQRRRSQVLSNV